MKKSWKERYVEHTRSPYWKELKRKVVKRRGCKCEACGCVDTPLDLHHKHYRTFGRERQKDVQLLCRPCHKQADVERKKHGDAERAWCRLCGSFGGHVSDGDYKLLSELGYIGSEPWMSESRRNGATDGQSQG